jgi:hypothetical protein
MNADEAFFDRLCDNKPHPVNLQSAGADSEVSARSAEVWTAVAVYHTGGHKLYSSACICGGFIGVHLR